MNSFPINIKYSTENKLTHQRINIFNDEIKEQGIDGMIALCNVMMNPVKAVSMEAGQKGEEVL